MKVGEKMDIDALTAKKADRIAIEEMKISSLKLMNNASRAVAERIIENHPGKKILVISGTGNNGADGLCIASILKDNGFEIVVNVIGDLSRGTWEFYYQLSKYKKGKGELYFNEEKVFDHDVLVDALYGVGLNREIEGLSYKLIKKLNKYDSYKIAVDIPSGLNPDDGKVMGICLAADETVTFGRNKKGFRNSTHTGKVLVRKIGIPEIIYERLINETK